MVRKVFLLGRPGSGKSTADQEIRRLSEGRGWTTQHIFDYRLLQEMFLREKDKFTSDQEKKFLPQGPEECNGFNVCDFSVLDTVLEEMAEEVRQVERRDSEQTELILLEFARDNYTRALFLFGSDFLQNALLVYLKVDFVTCIDRIRQRVDCDCRSGSYNHFVSDDIMRSYYRQDDWSEVIFNLKHTWDISVKAWEVENTCDCQALKEQIERLVDTELIPEPVPG